LPCDLPVSYAAPIIHCRSRSERIRVALELCILILGRDLVPERRPRAAAAKNFLQGLQVLTNLVLRHADVCDSAVAVVARSACGEHLSLQSQGAILRGVTLVECRLSE
jgi:hypothetical protein